MSQRIAIIGTGIAGNTAAWKLRDRFDITVFEAANYVGGHTNTIDVTENGKSIAVDTGFIVFNEHTYPNFIRILDEIGQDSKSSNMSFSVHAADDSIEYTGGSLNGVFAQRRNLLRPSFYRMVGDIMRFNRDAVRDIMATEQSITVGEYLRQGEYSESFREHYLIPMVAAIWSAEPVAVLDMPAWFLVRFFKNHGLMQIGDHLQWRVIKGGSREYVERLVEGHRDRIRLNSPVLSLKRTAAGVEIVSETGGRELFDFVFVACHSDQALAMLADATPEEREVLGAIAYQPNEAVLHTDERLLPRRKRAWAAWNYFVPDRQRGHVAVSYNMNILQGLEAQNTYIVTLNDDTRIDPDKILRRISYDHPMFTLDSIAAQARQRELNCDRTFFCGAYWRNGFHEDGVVSALHAVEHFEERLERGELHLRRAG